MKKIAPLVAALVLGVAAARSAPAQIPGMQISQTLVSRSSLESLLTQLEAASRSPEYSQPVRERARRMAGDVRQRLADGDFRIGDRILLDVEGESALADTFTVEAGRQVLLPNIGMIPLQGVLRVELNEYLTQRLRQFLRDPKVRARPLIKITVMGAVGRQGFHTVPVDITVDQVLEIAGGIAATADLDKIEIRRSNETLYDGEAVQQHITAGVTIDVLGVQAGDRFFVDALPIRQQSTQQTVRTLQYLLALPFSVLAVARLFGL